MKISQFQKKLIARNNSPAFDLTQGPTFHLGQSKGDLSQSKVDSSLESPAPMERKHTWANLAQIKSISEEDEWSVDGSTEQKQKETRNFRMTHFSEIDEVSKARAR